MRLKHLSALVAAVAVLAGPSAATAAPDVNTTGLRQAVTPENVFAHQGELEAIADANDGTRDTRTPGYLDSVDYVVSQLRSYGYDPQTVQFNMPEWRETAPPIFQQLTPTAKTYTPGTAADDNSPSVDYITFEHSPTNDDVPSAPVVPTNDIVIPSPGGSTSGCEGPDAETSDFPPATRGAVSLIQRGTCTFVEKLDNAQAAGAVGVILFNEGDSAGRMNALFRSGPTDLAIPAVLSSFAVGKELYDAFTAGQNPTVHLQTFGVDEDKFYPQVLAETAGGNADKVVVAGAHLDSVAAGPGVNDDGSGTSAQLEMAKQIARKELVPRQKLRFMWFGGEEEGLVGSQYYAANLPQSEVDKIMVMIDTDMISSPNFARFVYDGDGSEPDNPTGPPGSGEVERVFADFWDSQGLSSEQIPFDGRSDYVGFTDRGIPAGGIFSGAEVPKSAAQEEIYGGAANEQFDPCYHIFCDRLSSILGSPPVDVMIDDPANAAKMQGGGERSMRQFLPAFVHTIWHFAKGKNPLPSRTAAPSATTRDVKWKFKGHKPAKDR